MDLETENKFLELEKIIDKLRDEVCDLRCAINDMDLNVENAMCEAMHEVGDLSDEVEELKTNHNNLVNEVNDIILTGVVEE